MIRINLLPVKALQAEVTRRREIVIGAVVFGAVLALLIGAHIYQTLELSGLQSELARCARPSSAQRKNQGSGRSPK
jgi:hypothetical protein